MSSDAKQELSESARKLYINAITTTATTVDSLIVSKEARLRTERGPLFGKTVIKSCNVR